MARTAENPDRLDLMWQVKATVPLVKVTVGRDDGLKAGI
jgi:hypothetical protein